jgi:hypothetical protein
MRPVHPELPMDTAWQQGRRLYVRCTASSKLSSALHARGAQWDPYAKALWLSTRHREQVTAWTLAYHQARERAQQVRSAGLWVAIPYQAELLRARAKALGAIFDGTRKMWAMPTPADLVEIEELVEVWTRARAAERAEAERQRRAYWEAERRRAALEAAEQRRAAQQAAETAAERRLEEAALRDAERRKAAARADTFRAELARTVDRVLLGPLEVRREVFPRFTTGDDARAAAPHIGAVLRLEDGRRALVWGRKVRFVPRDEATTFGMERPHWSAEYRLAIVAPSEDELDTETARARERIDAEELHALAGDAALLTCPAPVERLPRISDPVGTIKVTTGVNGLLPAGRLVLDRTGTVWWQHPGHYDTYMPVLGAARDTDLAARFRAALAGGPRRRHLPPAEKGHLPLYYEVICHDRDG